MPAIDKAIHHHAAAGSWEAAAAHIAVFLQWAAERGLTSGEIDRARAGSDPLRYLLDDLDATLPDWALTAEGAELALELWEKHRAALQATAGRFRHPDAEQRRRHFAWLDERLRDSRRLRGELGERSPSTADAFLALAAEGAALPDAELERTVARALEASPTAVHLLEVAPPRAAVGARPRKLHAAGPNLVRFGEDAWDAVRDVVSPLEVDLQDFLDVFGDEACAAWLVHHLERALPGVDASALQRVVSAQFFVEVRDAGDTPLARGAIVTNEEFGAAAQAAYVEGATPPMGRRRIVCISQIAHYRRPLRERQATPDAPEQILLALARRADAWFPEGTFSGLIERSRAGLLVARLEALGESPLTPVQQGAVLDRLLVARGEGSVVVVVSFDGSRWLVRGAAEGWGEPTRRTAERALDDDEVRHYLAAREALGLHRGLGPSARDGHDGADWLLESVEHGRYRAVRAWEPEGALRTLGECLLGACGHDRLLVT